ncbi:hypothetical protein BRAO375_2320025 [Bradyrhizobium sp. ORS 375]|nr:hypothetical protein BRAO375_2320025 [Bradyrhizobium sp. ORS 375]
MARVQQKSTRRSPQVWRPGLEPGRRATGCGLGQAVVDIAPTTMAAEYGSRLKAGTTPLVVARAPQSPGMDDQMKDEYDFSNVERGRSFAGAGE